MLGLRGDRPVLIGECRWQEKAFAERDLAELRRKAAWLPISEEPRFALWSRGDGLAGHPDVWFLGPDEVVGRR